MIIQLRHHALVGLLLALGVQSADADNHPVTMWEIDGKTNRVFLLGSVHLLRPADYPIPGVIYSAYEEAEALIMELDMDDIDALAMQQLVFELGLMSEGQTLRDAIGGADFAEAEALALAVGIPMSALTPLEPWLAAVTAEVMILSRIGFDPAHGIEAHLQQKAENDGKEISGLETERQQLEILDGLSADAQREMLMDVLADGEQLATIMDDMITAWRNGDIEYLKQELLAEMRDRPELYKSLVVDRNIEWVQQIEPLLDDADDYLIIVGALHLVGEDGLPTLLRESGYSVVQLQE